jgi:hypothetical protein
MVRYSSRSATCAKEIGDSRREHHGGPAAQQARDALVHAEARREAARHLDALYRTVGTWPSFDVFAPLEDFVRRVYLRIGMRMTQTIFGAPYLQVP